MLLWHHLKRRHKKEKAVSFGFLCLYKSTTKVTKPSVAGDGVESNQLYTLKKKLCIIYNSFDLPRSVATVQAHVRFGIVNDKAQKSPLSYKAS